MKMSDRLYVPGFIQAEKKSHFILQVGDGMTGSEANRTISGTEPAVSPIRD